MQDVLDKKMMVIHKEDAALVRSFSLCILHDLLGIHDLMRQHDFTHGDVHGKKTKQLFQIFEPFSPSS